MQLVAHDLTHAHRSGSFVLQVERLELDAGAFCVVAGACGSGKSTLLRCLAGSLPAQGSVRLGDCFLDTTDGRSLRAWRTRVGFMAQHADQQLFARTAWEDVCFGPRNLGIDGQAVKERAEEALRMVGIDPERARQTSPFSYSGGEKHRLALAGVLALRPSCLLLDEPTAGLDSASTAALMGVLHGLCERGVTVLMATHDLDLAAAHADYAVVLSQGSVLGAGPAGALLSDEPLLAQAQLQAPAPVRMLSRLRQRGWAIDGDSPCACDEQSVAALVARTWREAVHGAGQL